MRIIKTNKIAPYLYLLPYILVTIFIYGYSIPSIFIFSFQRVKGITGEFIGLDNYATVFSDMEFQYAIKNNLQMLIIVPVIIFIALVIAVFIFEGVRGWKFYRTAIFIPYIIPITVAGITFGYIFTLRGVFNEFLSIINLKSDIDWLGNPDIALWTLMSVVVWKELGFGMMLFLARLMSVDESLYDAAKIDGANWIKRFVHVTIPQMATIIEFFAVITVINLLSWVFAYAYVVTFGGPGNATMVLELFIYKQLMRWSIPRVGTGAAGSVLLFIIVLVLVFGLIRVRKGIDIEIE
ncbi:MAG: carbohydrate ABC transporter permease [Candidatus Hodarchaeales archaeon]|jgi:ABC-type sugar transport system permease subunit